MKKNQASSSSRISGNGLSPVKVLAVVAAFAFAASLSPVHAQVTCGGSIGPDGNFQMMGDLSCTNEGITVVGPVNFNMKGFTLDCNGDDEHGITVLGERAVIQNGTITDCDDGVRVRGDGGHQLLKLTVRDNDSEGFHVKSDNNTFVGNTADDNGADGFDIDSSGNKFVDNLATKNNTEGIDLDSGGADSNRLVGNTAHDNDEEGFEIDSGATDNVLINNTATENGESGFDIDSSDNLLLNNSASGSGDDGFEIGESDDRNELRNNTTGNAQNGIHLEAGAEDNVVRQNTATGNTGTDLVDDTAGCGSNTWLQNTFGSSNQVCVE
jgi:parallel beta-helix repeat protein